MNSSSERRGLTKALCGRYEDQFTIVQDDGTIVTDSEEYDYTFYSLVSDTSSSSAFFRATVCFAT